MNARNAILVLVALALVAGGAWLLLAGTTALAPAPDRERSAEAPAKADARVPGAAPAPDAPSAPGDSAAAGRGVVWGILVRSRTGEPIRGRAELRAADGRSWSSEADARGVFRIAGAPPRTPLAFEASSPGLAPFRDPRLYAPAEGEAFLGKFALGAGETLTVSVVDLTARPVQGARVSLRRPSPWSDENDFHLVVIKPPAVSGTADESGVAVLSGVGTGSWVLQAEAAGFGADLREVEVAEGAARETIQAVLSPGASLGGRVIDAAGAPVAGVPVIALASTWWGDDDALRVTAATAADGEFRLEGLRPGWQSLAVYAHADVAEAGGTVDVPAVARVEIRLAPRAAVKGRVTDEATGAPIAGAAVRVDLRDRRTSDTVAYARATTGADGAFAMERLPADRIERVEVRADGFLPWPGSLTPSFVEGPALEPSAPLEIEARLHRGSAVEGTVRDEGGRPVQEAWVLLHVWSQDQSIQDAPPVRADAEGRYRIPGANPGRGYFQAGAQGLYLAGTPRDVYEAGQAGAAPESCYVHVPSEGSVVKDLVLSPEGRVEGKALFRDGRPAAGFQPTLSWKDCDGNEQGTLLAAPTREDGSFAFGEVIPSDAWNVEVSGPGGRKGRAEGVSVRGGETTSGVIVTVEEGASLAGRVRGEDGKPVAGASLRVVPHAFEADEAYRWEWWLRAAPVVPVAEDGTFRVEGLEAGTHTICASAPGCPPTRGPRIDLVAGGEETGLEVVLARGLPLAGVVTGPDGTAVAGARVEVTSNDQPNGGGEDAAAAVTDAQGRFRKDGLPGGSYAVRVVADGMPAVQVQAEAGDEDLRIALASGKVLAGRLVDGTTGEPAGGVHVEAWRSDLPGNRRWRDRAETVSRADGTFSLEGIVDGTYSLQCGERASSERSPWACTSVEGVAAGRTDVVVRMKRGLSIAGRVVDPDGSPIDAAGLQVEIGFTRGGSSWSTSRDLGPGGTFLFSALEAGVYQVKVESSGWGPERNRTWIGEEIPSVQAGTEDLVITLRRGLPISGKIVDAEGRCPGKDLWVSLAFADTGEAVPAGGYVSAGDDGTFTTPALDPARTYNLGVRNDSGFQGIARHVAPGATGVLVRPEARTGAVSGTVVDEQGRPVPAGLTVFAQPLDFGEGASSRTVEGGSFRIEGLGNVRHRLTLADNDSEFAPPEVDPIAAPGATGIVLKLRKGHSLRGTLRRADGRPFRGWIIVERVRGGETDCNWWGVDKNTGAFEVKGFAEGEEVVLRAGTSGLEGQEIPELARVRIPCEALSFVVEGLPDDGAEEEGE